MTTVETRAGNAALSATGGSARSQLDELQERSWKPRPRVALLVAGASFVVPVASALVAVQIAARVVQRPAGAGPVVAWLGALIVIAVLTSGASNGCRAGSFPRNHVAALIGVPGSGAVTVRGHVEDRIGQGARAR